MSNVDSPSQHRKPEFTRPSPQTLLNHVGIVLPSYAPRRSKTICPVCSEHRRKKRLKCLFVIIKSDGDVGWKCNHCDWRGPTAEHVIGLSESRPWIPPPYAEQEVEWMPMLPVPDDAKAPRDTQLSCDHLSTYRDKLNRLLFFIRRFDQEDGKLILPLTYGRLGDKVGWHQRRCAPPIPLYKLNLLSAYPSAPVCLMEGEKKTDHFNALCERENLRWIGLSWCGGAKCAEHASLRPLKGRIVMVWPDADLEGRAAGELMVKRLKEVRAWPALLNTSDLADGFDCGDVTELGAFLHGRTVL